MNSRVDERRVQRKDIASSAYQCEVEEEDSLVDGHGKLRGSPLVSMVLSFSLAPSNHRGESETAQYLLMECAFYEEK